MLKKGEIRTLQLIEENTHTNNYQKLDRNGASYSGRGSFLRRISFSHVHF